jgi:hypothetical protein
MHWRDFWHYVLLWGGWGVAAITAIYYGPQKMLQTWDWYMERFFDFKVEDYLRRQIKLGMMVGGTQLRLHNPLSTKIIADALGWSERKTLSSLKRLYRRHKVTESNFQYWQAKD